MSDGRHCYRIRLPSAAEAYRIRGIEPPPARVVCGRHYEAASKEPGPEAILCGSLGPPCFHPIVHPTWLVAVDYRLEPGSMDYFRNGPGYRLIHEYRARVRGCGLEMHYVGIVRK